MREVFSDSKLTKGRKERNDEVPKMNIENISVNTQSSIRIAGSKILYFDPFQIVNAAHDADMIFVTHSHYDHLDPESIEKIAGDHTVFIAPASIEKEMRNVTREKELILMNPGEKQEIGELPVRAVLAYNRLKPFHPKRNQWNGYVLTMDGVRYYVAGDTDAVNDLTSIRCDVALVPIGGTYTMNAKEAAKLINTISPEIAVPTHYGCIVGKKQDADVFRENVKAGIRVEVLL